MSTQARTFRGRSVEELVPQIRAELGEDAVIVDRREHFDGGVGGFFQKRLVEVDAVPGHQAARFERVLADADPAYEPWTAADEEEEPDAAPRPPAPATRPHVDARVTDVSVDEILAPSPDAARLAAMFDAGRAMGMAPQAPAEEAAPRAEETPVAEPGVPAPSSWEPPVVRDVEPPRVDPAPPEPETEPEIRPATFAALSAQEAAAEAPPTPEAPAPVAAEAPAAPAPVPVPDVVAPAPSPAAVAPTAPPSPQGEAGLLAAALVERGLPDALARRVVAEAAEAHAFRPAAGLRELVVETLARRIPVAPLGAGARTVAIVGPGGAGKTRVAARLLAAHRQAGHEVAAVALRADDGGAELARLLAPHGVPLHAPADGAAASGFGAEALAVLDTPGTSPAAEAELRALAADVRASGATEVHLALPATTGAGAARELLEAFRGVGVTAIVLTHVDETQVLGTGAGLAAETGVPLSYVSRGREVAAGLRPADPVALAEALLA